MRSCSDAALPPLPDCNGLDAAHDRLCRGVRSILGGSCAALTNISRLATVIAEIGVVPDSRGQHLYGAGAKQMVRSPGGVPNVGLWQEPLQLAAALIEVATSRTVHRYVEVGGDTPPAKQSRPRAVAVAAIMRTQRR